jgi:ketosteroid isomerase-like protein
MGETIRSLYGCDWLGVDQAKLEQALLEFFDPNVVLVSEPAAEQVARYVGIGEIVRLLTDARREWAGCHYLVEEVTEAPGGQVLVSGRLVADLRQSGSRVSLRFAHRWTTRDQRVVKLEAL